MVEQVAGMLQIMAAVGLKLARAGRRVRIVTDHGWLLLSARISCREAGTGLADTRGRAVPR